MLVGEERQNATSSKQNMKFLKFALILCHIAWLQSAEATGPICSEYSQTVIDVSDTDSLSVNIDLDGHGSAHPHFACGDYRLPIDTESMFISFQGTGHFTKVGDIMQVCRTNS